MLYSGCVYSKWTGKICGKNNNQGQRDLQKANPMLLSVQKISEPSNEISSNVCGDETIGRATEPRNSLTKRFGILKRPVSWFTLRSLISLLLYALWTLLASQRHTNNVTDTWKSPIWQCYNQIVDQVALRIHCSNDLTYRSSGESLCGFKTSKILRNGRMSSEIEPA